MEKQDIEQGQSEKAPLTRGGSGAASEGKKAEGKAQMKAQMKAKMKAKVKAKAQEKIPQSIQKKGQQVADEGNPCITALCLSCCGFFSVSFLVFIVYKIVKYYIDVFDAREEKDSWEVSVSEQWIDYLSPTKELVNCTNSEPCRNWDCSYVREHFHKDLPECEYEDNMIWVTIGLLTWIICMIRTAKP